MDVERAAPAVIDVGRREDGQQRQDKTQTLHVWTVESLVERYRFKWTETETTNKSK